MRLDVTKPPQATKNSTVATIYLLPSHNPRAARRAPARTTAATQFDVALADDGRTPSGESGPRVWEKHRMTRRSGAGARPITLSWGGREKRSSAPIKLRCNGLEPATSPSVYLS
jgi:hypothetical protein